MDISHYMQFGPLFGAWAITRWLRTDGYGDVFEIERQDHGTVTKAALKAVHIPSRKSEIKKMMPTLRSDAEISTYLKAMATGTVQEINIMRELKGQSNILAYEEHKIIELPEKNGLDILIRMELLTPLSDHIQGHVMNEAEVIKLGIDICSALEACQRHSVIHRGISADSIFVMPTGGFKLGGFHLACKAGEGARSDAPNRNAATLAPKLYRGETYAANADTYALGLVLYQLMNGNRQPFFPPAPPSDVQKHAQAVTGEWRSKPIQASSELTAVIWKACAPDPSMRFQTPSEMRSSLEKLITPHNKIDTTKNFKNIQKQYVENGPAIPGIKGNGQPAEHVSTKRDASALFEPGEGMAEDKDAQKHRKKMAEIIKMIVLSITILAVLGFAFYKNTGDQADLYLEGKGTIEKPYLVKSVEELEWVSTQVNTGTEFENVYFRQVRDLDFSDYENWIPIGTFDSGYCFRGIYDGGGVQYSEHHDRWQQTAWRLRGMCKCWPVRRTGRNSV